MNAGGRSDRRAKTRLLVDDVSWLPSARTAGETSSHFNLAVLTTVQMYFYNCPIET
jgi:hypothetical protein